MAYHLETTIQRYVGQSGDRKPRPEEMAPDTTLAAGSSFLESDTGRIFRWDGESWKHADPVDESAQVLQLILVELVLLRQRVELAVS